MHTCLFPAPTFFRSFQARDDHVQRHASLSEDCGHWCEEFLQQKNVTQTYETCVANATQTKIYVCDVLQILKYLCDVTKIYGSFVNDVTQTYGPFLMTSHKQIGQNF